MAVSRALAGLLASVLCLPAAAAPATAAFDPAHTAFGFQLRTRWGQRVVGAFPRHAGEVRYLDGDRRQVHVVLDTAAVQIDASPRYTAIARGPRFFDSARHPRITFTSEPFAPALLERGGALRGTLTLHGVTRDEVFELEPAPCARAGVDCDVVARGSVQRDDYGLDGLPMMLGGRVHFSLRVRIAPAP